MKKKSIQILVTLVLSVVALWFALRGIKFDEVGAALRQVQWGWLLVSEALIIVTLFIRAQRWRVLMGYKTTLLDTFGLINIGYLVSAVIPFRAGDAARAIGAGLRSPISAIAALSTVVVERVFDMFLIVLILLGTLPFVPGLRTYLAAGQVNAGLSFNLVLALSGSLSLGIMAIFVLVALFPRKVEMLAFQTLERLNIPQPERWLRPVQHVLEGLTTLSSARAGLELLGWSVLLWIATVAYFYAAMLGCRAFLPEISPLKSVVAVWASAFGMVFPAQGGLGSFHFAVREALFWGFATPRNLGFTYAVVIHILPYLSGIILGAITLLLWGVSLKRVVSAGDLNAAQPE